MFILPFCITHVCVCRDYANIRNYSGVSLSLRNVSRDKILDDILKQIGKCSEVLFWRGPLWVTFKGEAGSVASGNSYQFLFKGYKYRYLYWST